MSSARLLVLATVMFLSYLSFYLFGPGANEVLLFMAVNIVCFGVLGYVLLKLRKVVADAVSTKNFVLIVIVTGVLFRLCLVPHTPVASDDMYRYVWDGKVAANGINPFAFAPSDTALSHLQTADLPSKVNFPHMRTIYPPFAQVVFLLSNFLFGDSLAGLKLLLVVADICSLVLLVVLLGRLGLDRRNVVLYAWSPMPIMYFGLDGHVDALGIPFLLLASVFAVSNKKVHSAAALGFAILAKLFPIFIVPMLVRARFWYKDVWIVLLPLGMLIVGSWFYYEPTWGIVESLGVYSATWQFNGSIFVLLKNLMSVQIAHTASAVLLLIWIAVVFFLDRPFLEKTFLVLLGFILVNAVVHPWYLTWLAALIVLRWSPALFVFLILSNLSNYVVYEYLRTGFWMENSLLLLVEYLPVYSLLVWEIARRKFSSQRGSVIEG